MTADDLITLNEEIAGMARAGLPLDQGLAALEAGRKGVARKGRPWLIDQAFASDQY